MSGVEIVGLALGVAGLATDLAFSLSTFSRTVKSANRSIRYLHREVSEVETVTHLISTSLSEDKLTKAASEKLKNAVRSALKSCEDVLKEISTAVNATGVKKESPVDAAKDLQTVASKPSLFRRLKFTLMEDDLIRMRDSLRASVGSMGLLVQLLLSAAHIKEHPGEGLSTERLVSLAAYGDVVAGKEKSLSTTVKKTEVTTAATPTAEADGCFSFLPIRLANPLSTDPNPPKKASKKSKRDKKQSTPEEERLPLFDDYPASILPVAVKRFEPQLRDHCVIVTRCLAEISNTLMIEIPHHLRARMSLTILNSHLDSWKTYTSQDNWQDFVDYFDRMEFKAIGDHWVDYAHTNAKEQPKPDPVKSSTFGASSLFGSIQANSGGAFGSNRPASGTGFGSIAQPTGYGSGSGLFGGRQPIAWGSTDEPAKQPAQQLAPAPLPPSRKEESSSAPPMPKQRLDPQEGKAEQPSRMSVPERSDDTSSDDEAEDSEDGEDEEDEVSWNVDEIRAMLYEYTTLTEQEVEDALPRSTDAKAAE